MIHRRALLVAFAVAACSKKIEARCGFCGMRIDPSSPWRAELVDGSAENVGSYDSPKCALLAFRAGKVPPAVHVRVLDFYDREWHLAEDVSFAVGSDVVGPMGADVVPVDAARAPKFASDHRATSTVKLADLTTPFLRAL